MRLLKDYSGLFQPPVLSVNVRSVINALCSLLIGNKSHLKINFNEFVSFESRLFLLIFFFLQSSFARVNLK